MTWGTWEQGRSQRGEQGWRGALQRAAEHWGVRRGPSNRLEKVNKAPMKFSEPRSGAEHVGCAQQLAKMALRNTSYENWGRGVGGGGTPVFGWVSGGDLF